MELDLTLDLIDQPIYFDWSDRQLRALRMGTDRDEIENGPCPCGQGLIRIDHCSPDHPWGGSSWYEADIDCAACAKTLAITYNAQQQLKLVRKSDLKKKDELTELWHEKRREIEASGDFSNLRSAVESGLSTCGSMAARHRFLVHAGLSYKSLANYRKHPSYSLTASNALEVARALQIKAPELEKMAADLEERWQATKIDIPAVETGLRHLEK